MGAVRGSAPGEVGESGQEKRDEGRDRPAQVLERQAPAHHQRDGHIARGDRHVRQDALWAQSWDHKARSMRQAGRDRHVDSFNSPAQVT